MSQTSHINIWNAWSFVILAIFKNEKTKRIDQKRKATFYHGSMSIPATWTPSGKPIFLRHDSGHIRDRLKRPVTTFTLYRYVMGHKIDEWLQL